MNKVIPWLFLLFSAPAFSGALLARWVDPTPASDAYVARYEAEVNVNGAQAARQVDLTSPELALTLDAPEGAEVAVRYRAVNVVAPAYPVEGQWSPWHVAASATRPGEQSPPSLLLYVR